MFTISRRGNACARRSCSGRGVVGLQHSEDVAVWIFCVAEPAYSRNGHDRQGNRSAQLLGAGEGRLGRRHADGADKRIHRLRRGRGVAVAARSVRRRSRAPRRTLCGSASSPSVRPTSGTTNRTRPYRTRRVPRGRSRGSRSGRLVTSFGSRLSECQGVIQRAIKVGQSSVVGAPRSRSSAPWPGTREIMPGLVRGPAPSGDRFTEHRLQNLDAASRRA